MAFLFYFDDMNYVVSNGKLVDSENAGLLPDDHSYRYGDGLFETLKVADGNILFAAHHFERLFSGLNTLKFSVPSSFTKQHAEAEIKKLCLKNGCEKLARVRLSVSRGTGGLYDCDNKFSYLIECWPLAQTGFNENGLIIDVFPDARKSIDVFANLKSANYLPYIMAAVWAKENNLNDALVLNSNDRICDATIANVFWVRNDVIFTPSLSEGCVAGVMRKKILSLAIQDPGFNVKESVLSESELLEADEVFLTNVISGIRWVKQCREKRYIKRVSSKIFSDLL